MPGSEPSQGCVRLLCYSDANRLAGAEGVLRAIVAKLDKAYTVTVVGHDDDVVAGIASGSRFVHTEVVERVGRRNPAGLWTLRQTMKRQQPDVVHINLTDMAAALPATIAALSLRRVAVVIVEHHPWPPQSPFQKVAKMATVRLANAHVAVSASLANAVAAVTRRDPKRIQVIANGVPAVPCVDRPPFEGRPFEVGVACRLDRVKGVDVVLRAVAKVASVNLVVAGDGPERDALEQMASRLGISDRVRFLGWVDDSTAVYDNIDVFVLGSRAEALPLSILEAMHAGRAVVATNVGGVAEAVVHGVTGLVVPPEDPDALANALADLASNEAVTRSMGTAGRLRARQEFDLDLMVTRYQDVYESVRPRSKR